MGRRRARGSSSHASMVIDLFAFASFCNVSSVHLSPDLLQIFSEPVADTASWIKETTIKHVNKHGFVYFIYCHAIGERSDASESKGYSSIVQ